jgi:hypothetical protein
MVTNQQLYLAIGAPMLFNVVLIGIVAARFNARLGDISAHFSTRLDDLRDLWRVELRRVEEVLDASPEAGRTLT